LIYEERRNLQEKNAKVISKSFCINRNQLKDENKNNQIGKLLFFVTDQFLEKKEHKEAKKIIFRKRIDQNPIRK